MGVLDFTQSTETLGKPRGQDLASGNLTAPAIFALQRDAEADGQLLDIIDSEFVEEDSLDVRSGMSRSSVGSMLHESLRRSTRRKLATAYPCSLTVRRKRA